MTIQNLPTCGELKPYIVAREYDGEYWYYGMWDILSVAEDVAEEIGGIVIVGK